MITKNNKGGLSLIKQESPGNFKRKRLSRNDCLKIGGIIIVLMFLIGLFTSCSPTTTTTSPTINPTAVGTAAPTAIGTIKIGMVFDFGSDVNMDALNSIKILELIQKLIF